MKTIYEIKVKYDTFSEYEKDSEKYEKDGFLVSTITRTNRGEFKVTYRKG